MLFTITVFVPVTITGTNTSVNNTKDSTQAAGRRRRWLQLPPSSSTRRPSVGVLCVISLSYYVQAITRNQ